MSILLGFSIAVSIGGDLRVELQAVHLVRALTLIRLGITDEYNTEIANSYISACGTALEPPAHLEQPRMMKRPASEGGKKAAAKKRAKKKKPDAKKPKAKKPKVL